MGLSAGFHMCEQILMLKLWCQYVVFSPPLLAHSPLIHHMHVYHTRPNPNTYHHTPINIYHTHRNHNHTPIAPHPIIPYHSLIFTHHSPYLSAHLSPSFVPPFFHLNHKWLIIFLKQLPLKSP
jgi:hypothetical protein